MSALDEAKPWNSAIRESTDNLDFWLHELQEPALLYSAARAEEAISSAYQARELGDRKGGGKLGNGKGGHPRKMRGTYITNADGLQLCHRFNKDGCVDDCPRSHQCPVCLGPHRITDCTRASAKVKRKATGKGKTKDSYNVEGSK